MKLLSRHDTHAVPLVCISLWFVHLRLSHDVCHSFVSCERTEVDRRDDNFDVVVRFTELGVGHGLSLFECFFEVIAHVLAPKRADEVGDVNALSQVFVAW